MSDPLPLSGKRVCVDPGHPSENGAGGQGRHLTEVGVAWRVGARLEKLLREAGASVCLTKTRERQTVTNLRRAQIANAFHADLAVRLHCDAAPGVRGIATYYPDREGSIRGTRGPSPLVQTQSRALARRLYPALVAALGGALADRGLLTDRQTAIGARQGGALTGSIHSLVPVVLVEMCVLTDPHDEAFIAGKDGEAQMARALLAGVVAALTG